VPDEALDPTLPSPKRLRHRQYLAKYHLLIGVYLLVVIQRKISDTGPELVDVWITIRLKVISPRVFIWLVVADYLIFIFSLQERSTAKLLDHDDG
jgi:hypothetical protein